jgi:purine-binding chemotaxis protein CheW
MNAAIAKTVVKTASEGQYVTLAIDREVFAVPVDTVLEILDMRQASRIPESPHYMLGLIDLRGRSIPVLDLRAKLGLPTVEPTEMTRILVLEVTIAGRQLVLGLVADRVIEVMALSASEIEPAPDIGVRWRSDYILGVGHRDGKFVIIFNVSRLFTEEDTEAFLTSAAA